ncbi:MAG: SLC13 family permease [Chloroflexota bacterium]
MSLSQIIASLIFLVMFGAIVWAKIHRMIPALIGAALVILVVFLGVMQSPETVLRVLSLGQLGTAKFWYPGAGHFAEEAHGINWQTIVFIAGMMLMVEGLSAVGFFRWLCLWVARLVKCQVIPILIAFMVLSGFLSMFIDSITVMLFLATVTIELARLLKFDPVPVIIAEIFAANTGGSATMSGDPPNIIIGTALGYSFMDFVENTGLMAWAGMILALLFFYLAFRKPLTTSQKGTSPEELLNRCPAPGSAITSPLLFKIQSLIFLLVIILLVTHAETGLSVAIIGVIAALLTTLAGIKHFRHIMHGVDWRTLLFFIGLFICVGGLEETGVLKAFAQYIERVSGGSLFIVISIILWVSAFASAIVDNIPFAATMVPVIRQLSVGLGASSLPTMAWGLALGTDIGGNATPIGASANVVGTAISEREGYPISWSRFLKYALPSMILVIALVHLMMVWRYDLMGR